MPALAGVCAGAGLGVCVLLCVKLQGCELAAAAGGTFDFVGYTCVILYIELLNRGLIVIYIDRRGLCYNIQRLWAISACVSCFMGLPCLLQSIVAKAISRCRGKSSWVFQR